MGTTLSSLEVKGARFKRPIWRGAYCRQPHSALTSSVLDNALRTLMGWSSTVHMFTNLTRQPGGQRPAPQGEWHWQEISKEQGATGPRSRCSALILVN